MALFEPGERSRAVDISSSWVTELAMWLRVPRQAADPRYWALLLLPERVDPAYRFPDATVHVYQALRWSGPMPLDSVPMRAATKWVSRDRAAIEVGIETSAGPADEPTASSLTVARVDTTEESGEVATFGTPIVPPTPDTGGETTRGKQLVFSESDLIDFMRLLGDVHALHSSLAFAHRRGYSNLLVQGHVQMLTLMTFAGVPETGTVEAWFRHPITVGAALAADARPLDDSEVWTLRQTVDEAPATTMRIS